MKHFILVLVGAALGCTVVAIFTNGIVWGIAGIAFSLSVIGTLMYHRDFKDS